MVKTQPPHGFWVVLYTGAQRPVSVSLSRHRLYHGQRGQVQFKIPGSCRWPQPSPLFPPRHTALQRPHESHVQSIHPILTTHTCPSRAYQSMLLQKPSTPVKRPHWLHLGGWGCIDREFKDWALCSGRGVCPLHSCRGQSSPWKESEGGGAALLLMCLLPVCLSKTCFSYKAGITDLHPACYSLYFTSPACHLSPGEDVFCCNPKQI